MSVRPRPTPPGEVFYARTFALLTLFVLGFLSYRILLPLYAALAWAAFIAFLLHPLQIRLVRLLHGRKSIAAGLLTIATVLVVLGPLTGLGAAFAVQVDEVLKIAQRLATQQMSGQGATVVESSGLGSMVVDLQNHLGIAPAQVREWAADGTKIALQSLAAVGGKIFMGALGTALGFTITMFVLFFLLRDGDTMLATVHGLIPMPRPDKRRLFDHLSSVIHALIYGTGLTALIQGVLVGIGFAVLGLPAPVVFGVLAALFALLPLVGTPLVWGPAVIALAAQGRWVGAFVLLAWGILVSTIDNVLRPYFVSGRARIGALTVFIGVIGGVSAFGAVGLFLGPVVLSLGIALARFTLEMREPQNGTRPPQVPPRSGHTRAVNENPAPKSEV